MSTSSSTGWAIVVSGGRNGARPLRRAEDSGVNPFGDSRECGHFDDRRISAHGSGDRRWRSIRRNHIRRNHLCYRPARSAANTARYVTGLGRVQSGMAAPQPQKWVGTGLPPNCDGNGQFMSACAATEHRRPGMQLIRVRAMRPASLSQEYSVASPRSSNLSKFQSPRHRLTKLAIMRSRPSSGHGVEAAALASEALGT
jgi:hypothetical protein